MQTTLGPFRLVSRLGKGGMGETFVGARKGAAGEEQFFCVKRLLPEDGSDPKLMQMFQREAGLMEHLRHPNLVALHELGRDGETWWMALELVEGLDLRALTSERRASGERLPLEVVLYIANELVKALGYAHGAWLSDGSVGIIHRDVSPSNILLRRDGAVKLADFGIAKVQSNERTRTGKIAGKVFYMSPEQSLGDALDGRSDLFSLGVVIFELLAGVRPFEGAADTQTQLNALNGVQKDLRELVPGLPPVLVKIVNRLLKRQPDRRFRNAGELLAVLEALPVRPEAATRLGAIVRASTPCAFEPMAGELTEREVTGARTRR